MLRPATPLTVLLLVAFALLLLSVLSVPVIKAIPLGSFQDVTFGFLGYCTADGCSDFHLGYGNVDNISRGTSADFTFSSGVRNTLSTILVLHPVAAFLTLVTLIMTVAMHTHSLSHSAGYMLMTFLLLVLNFLVCAAAFVVDLLLFLPHQAWGTYIVLAAAVLVLISAVATCGVRRHMIHRKNFRRNAGRSIEIGGDDYYNIQNLVPKPSFTTSSQPTVPMISGANGSPDQLPAFATFETITHEEVMNDDHFPLNMHTSSERSMAPTYRSHEELLQNGGVGVAVGGPTRSNSQDNYRPYMNNMNSMNGMNGHTAPYGAPRGMPNGRVNRGSYRGQNGGYHQQTPHGPMRIPSRGGPAYGPRGGRGGFGPNPRGAYGPSGIVRTEGRTPPLTHIPMAEPFDPRGPPDQQAPYRTQSPQSPQDRSANQTPMTPIRTYTPYSPEPDLPRVVSPPAMHDGLPRHDLSQPVEHPIELDATPAAPSGTMDTIGQATSGDTASAGSHKSHSPEGNVSPEKDGPVDHASADQYVPARAVWNQSPPSDTSDGTPPPPPAHDKIHSNSQERIANVSPIHDGGYYEDVDPRFDQSHGRQTNQQRLHPREDDHELARQRSPHWESRPPVPPSHAPRHPTQQRHDMVLDNSEFWVPRAGADGPMPRGPAAGMTPESAYPQGPL